MEVGVHAATRTEGRRGEVAVCRGRKREMSDAIAEGSVGKKARVERALDQLKEYTTVVADTGEVTSIQKFHPQDATTNPSLILKAAGLPEYAHLVSSAVEYAKAQQCDDATERLALAMDQLAVNFGAEISKIVPGYVSTEVDARLSFNTQATVARARRIIAMYAAKGVGKERILIKIASTYEGIRAGEILQKEGITCNLTLLFSLVQAAACAEAGITLISPFVGRILDWHKAQAKNKDRIFMAEVSYIRTALDAYLLNHPSPPPHTHAPSAMYIRTN